MARPLTPKTSLATAASLMLASSSLIALRGHNFCHRCALHLHSHHSPSRRRPPSSLLYSRGHDRPRTAPSITDDRSYDWVNIASVVMELR
jgi:hypothetical protein